MTTDAFFNYQVAVNDLRRACEPLTVDFETSDQLPSGTPFLGQQRAIDAIQLGLQIDSECHNVFVLGPPGSHRHGLAEGIAKAHAAKRPAPDDWCYVNNFADPEKPKTLTFPAGRGRQFRDDMRELIEELRLAIPAAFETDDYRNQVKAISAAAEKEVEQQWKKLERRASDQDVGLLQTPTGYVLAPLKDGKVLDEKEFGKLPKNRRETVQKNIERLSEELRTHIERMPQLAKKHREAVKTMNREITEHAVGVLITDLKEKYCALPAVVVYLDDVQRNIIDNADDFHTPQPSPLPFLSRDPAKLFGQYEINLIVSNEPDVAAPVVFEPNPNYTNIIGKVEHRAEMGALVTDFRMIRSGALLAANGGYVILDMHRVLSRPFVWDALKQALFARQVRIESPGETYGFVSTTSLQPAPIPLDIKVILVGERWLYYLLSVYDSEFKALFRVAADLDDELQRTNENVDAYALLVADRIREAKLLGFNREAMQKIIEQQARKAGDSERLSMHMRSLEDLLMQSDHWARQRGSEQVEAADVMKSIHESVRRLGRTQARIQEAIERDLLLIDTDGACVGQVNGLSVIDLGEHRFGHPVRITATTRIGSGRVVDIEREVELGGAVHSKGVMILSAALSSRYASEVPLSLYANLVFEQSYSGVEGDSASVAELCALLSSLSKVPVRQNLAVTGSVNQLGRVQVVGGVNEKIEGFFDICRNRGLDGTHGVVMPKDNVKHLMLREDVVEAVAQGKFSVYAVRRIDEALSILTGVEAGERDEDGEFPKETVNHKVERQLIRYAELRKSFAENSDGERRD